MRIVQYTDGHRYIKSAMYHFRLLVEYRVYLNGSDKGIYSPSDCTTIRIN